jgi:hypothetical protein
MTLYHYVPTKGDLLALMDNAIMAELLVPDGELAVDWRTAVTQIARRSRAALRRHPWAISGLRDARIGPNGMRHFEQSLAAVAGVPLDGAGKTEVMSLVDTYVLGFVIHEDIEPAELAGESLPAIAAYVAAQLETGEFPHIEELLGDDDPEAVIRRLFSEAWATIDERFERGLERLLDGIALHLHRS